MTIEMTTRACFLSFLFPLLHLLHQAEKRWRGRVSYFITSSIKFKKLASQFSRRWHHSTIKINVLCSQYTVLPRYIIFNFFFLSKQILNSSDSFYFIVYLFTLLKKNYNSLWLLLYHLVPKTEFLTNIRVKWAWASLM